MAAAGPTTTIYGATWISAMGPRCALARVDRSSCRSRLGSWRRTRRWMSPTRPCSPMVAASAPRDARRASQSKSTSSIRMWIRSRDALSPARLVPFTITGPCLLLPPPPPSNPACQQPHLPSNVLLVLVLLLCLAARAAIRPRQRACFQGPRHVDRALQGIGLGSGARPAEVDPLRIPSGRARQAGDPLHLQRHGAGLRARPHG